MLHNVIMAALAERAETEARWDGAPALFRVYLIGRLVSLVPVDLPPVVWLHPKGPAAGLEMIAQRIVAAARLTGPPRTSKHGILHGIAFLSEAWFVEPPPEGDHHAWRRIQHMANEHRLKEHPDAHEIRTIIAVDLHGVTYEARLTRGKAVASRLIMMPGEEPQAGGAIVESLDQMVEALTGAPAQKRPSPYLETGEMN